MSELQRLLAKRLAISIVLALVVVLIIFAVLRLLPGSPSELLVIAGSSSQQQITEIRAMYSLDQPVWRQCPSYLQSILLFQFGYPILRSQPVWEVLAPWLASTLILLVPALVTTAALSSLLGIYIGWNRRDKLGKLDIVTTTFLQSTSVFITGALFVIIFAYNLELVSTFGTHSINALPEGYVETLASFNFLHHYVLPFMVPVLYYGGDFLPSAHNGVVEERGLGFLKFRRAKGFSEMQQLAQADQNSMLPVLTYFALRFEMIFQGLIPLGAVFGQPGIGHELVLAIQQQDYLLVQTIIFITALAVIVTNLVTDALYAYFDPTASTGGGGTA